MVISNLRNRKLFEHGDTKFFKHTFPKHKQSKFADEKKLIPRREKGGRKNLMEGEAVSVFAGEFLHALERNSGGIVEIVNNYGGVTAVKQLKHSMASDVASAAGDQNILRHR